MPRDPLTTIVRRKALLRWMLPALAFGALISEAAAAEYTLERVALVSRHGVRAPTDSEKLKDYTLSRTWPDWHVADACLTPRGKMLTSLMGAFYREEFTTRGLFPAGRPPAANQIYVLADVVQRTKQTGEGLLDGLLARKPRELPPEVFCPSKKEPLTAAKGKPKQGDAENDPLFRPVEAGVCKFVRKDARDAVLDRVADRNLKNAWEPYSGGVQQLQDALNCCQPKPVCNKDSGACPLQSAPSDVTASETNVRLSGPIAIGSTVSEVLLLEYAQAMKEVAWGEVRASDQINPMLKLHDLQFDLIQRTRYIADRQGTALMHQVLETLRQTADNKSDLRRNVPAKARLVIYVGHDTNLANLGGMLGLDWQFKSGLGDKTPPAGAMAFELLREKGAPNNYFVRMAYYSQTLDQMREATKLTTDRSLKTTPEIVGIEMPASLCAKTQDGACPWGEFRDRVSKNILMDACIPKKS
jgi:4-phytase / acid phosphatase